MSYILFLAGWYPSKDDLYLGDFVQRHAKAISIYNKVVVLYIVKSKSVSSLVVDIKESENLTEIIYYYPSSILGKMLSIYQYYQIGKKACNQIISKYGKPSLVHVNIVWKAGLIALHLKNKMQLNYVITENSTTYYKADVFNYINNFKIRKFWFNKIYQQATALLPVTNDLGKQCNELFKINKPIYVIENAVEVQYFKYSKRQHNKQEFNFVHVSTMGYQKNTIALLQTLKQFVSSNEGKIKLHLIGPCLVEIQNYVSSNFEKNEVIITGNIPYIEVANYIKNADALLLFSRYENLPCVILEALCCGVPILATNVGGIREVVNKANGILVASENTTALLIAIQEMYKNLQHSYYNHELIAANAATQFSYAVIGKKYNEVYQLLVSKKS
jgi:glycosyltransferase involved in cell wall biosynthesis